MVKYIMVFEKNSPVLIAVFLFPILIATVRHGGGTIYVLLLLCGLTLGWSAWRSLEAWEKRLLIGFSIFFVLVSLSLVNTQDIVSGMKKVERYIHFPLLVPMYLLLKKYRIETGKVFLFGLSAASVVMFGQAFYQTSVLGWGRAVGAYNSLILGDVSMLAVVIIACALLTVSQNWRHHLLGFSAIGMALSASVMSGSRGAWILLPVAAVWFLWIKRKSLGTVSVILLVIMGLLLAWGALSLDQVKGRVDSAVSRFQDYSQDPTKVSSVGARFEMWRDSITIWKAHPLMGTGIGDFKNDRLQLFKDGKSNLAMDFGHAHNIYFDVLATAGLLGLVGMLVLMQIIPFQMFYSFWIKDDDPWIKFYALSGMTTIIAFAIFGLTEGWLARNMFVRTYLMSILVFMSSIAVIKMKRLSEPHR
ncbi:O-antigen ligase family protein [Beggiatoa alba]|nr:O-antigen ligase family protein [Beggiatoa alba]